MQKSKLIKFEGYIIVRTIKKKPSFNLLTYLALARFAKIYIKLKAYAIFAYAFFMKFDFS